MCSQTRERQRRLFDDDRAVEPVLISACLLGIPVPICPEQLGGMPTPRTSETLHGTGAQVLDGGLRIIAPEAGEDVTELHVSGAKYTLEIARIVGARRAYMKGGSPSCDRDGVAGEVLCRGGVRVIRIG